MSDEDVIEFSYKTVMLLALGFGLIVAGGALIGWRMSWFGGTHQIPWLTDQSWFANDFGSAVTLTFWGGAVLNVFAILGVVLCILGGVTILQAIFGR